MGSVMIGGGLSQGHGSIIITCGVCGKKTVHDREMNIMSNLVCECGNVLVIVGGETK